MTNQLFPIGHNVSLKKFNTFGIDVAAHTYLAINSLDMLQQVKQDQRLSCLKKCVLGGGSNVILTKDFDGLVLHMCNRGIALVGDDSEFNYIKVAAGENWHQFVQWSLANGFNGLENLSLIPGSVGAAPIQNIGAYGVEVKQFIASLDFFDFQSGLVRTLTAAECLFGYRDSIFKQALRNQGVIIDVTFALPKKWHANILYQEVANALADKEAVNLTAVDVSQAIIKIRHQKLPDPSSVGNVGSFFKNPVISQAAYKILISKHPKIVGHYQGDQIKLAAAWLIDQCGWKGQHMGQVGVYEKQALVLINLGGARGADVIALAQKIQADVLERFGVMLEPEPIYI